MKIAVTGPESSGKSTLSLALATQLEGIFVPEYARAYLNDLNRDYTPDDVVQIARGQAKSEDDLFVQDKVLCCDTDMLVCKIWMEFKYGYCDPWLEQEFRSRHYDLFILCDNLPWEPDPLRENPDPRDREILLDLYQKTLFDYRKPYIFVSGSPERRIQSVIRTLEAF